MVFTSEKRKKKKPCYILNSDSGQEAPPALIKNSITHLERLFTWPELPQQPPPPRSTWMAFVVFHKVLLFLSPTSTCVKRLTRRTGPAGLSGAEHRWGGAGGGREGEPPTGALYNQEEEENMVRWLNSPDTDTDVDSPFLKIYQSAKEPK